MWPRTRKLFSLSHMKLSASAADSALKGEPSWNLTPWRRVKRQVVGLVCSHLVASSPTSSLVFGSRLSKASSMLRMIWLL